MDYISIIMLGIVVNFLVNVMVAITMLHQTLIKEDFSHQMMFNINQINYNLAELKKVTDEAKFYIKYHNIIVMLLPFANILEAYKQFKSISEKGLNNHILSEIERIKKEKA